MRSLLASAFVIVIAVGCASGEALDEGTGTGGASGSGAGAAGAAGKVDNPNTGGAGGSVGGSSGDGGSTSGGSAGVSGSGTGGDGASGGAAGSASGGAGGSASGGAGGVGGGVGGAGGVGGSGGSGGTCPTGQKKCGGVCIFPAPGVGCSMSDCTPCSAPPLNSTATCSGDACDFTCNAGFTKQGGQCVSTGGSGGTGSGGTGSGGTGGGTGCPQPCDPSAGEQQFICTFLCATQGKFGICAPVINCCTCL